MNDCNNTNNQKLFLDEKERLVFNNNKCLDIQSDGLVFQSSCNDSNTQKWKYNNEQFKSNGTSKCLDIYAGKDTNNAEVGIFDCHDGTNQKWYWY